ncbi:hypothetical protein COY25_01805 [Candidatus Uhrbacteria bacterium CG_4_10_14_0_2_um_filter_41_7]|uniref:Uncharacterized protein n=1 Tax=Candidatus Uhrbacteria bacterium CG_4_9_14_3_um_filter_41_35 TaxID=1975034 RepID=A0A2M7XEZ1_9BACT|nr:MAG: hypothetical protein COV92_02825 [Candidatus Uhrbacteria bacterium CG11_big_fil_rev_8_21_14_0_20_41_9]PIZ54752.1 MAG: hypothetical protein COY25_01805 [Candidatus Uhrbacteria bacterium CG_4_10_14_0_2_um_filter_41_7]PJA46296.1 MAG: hypothetical protein CO173_03220 [Candidatus Uhrbacteria bacterium CG_4_9_14_3_um_filter_41_35]
MKTLIKEVTGFIVENDHGTGWAISRVTYCSEDKTVEFIHTTIHRNVEFTVATWSGSLEEFNKACAFFSQESGPKCLKIELTCTIARYGSGSSIFDAPNTDTCTEDQIFRLPKTEIDHILSRMR